MILKTRFAYPGVEWEMLLEQNSCLEEESAPGPASGSFQKHSEKEKKKKQISLRSAEEAAGLT